MKLFSSCLCMLTLSALVAKASSVSMHLTARFGTNSPILPAYAYGSGQMKLYTSLTGFDTAESDITPKLVTKQIMTFFDGSKNS